MAAPKRGLFFGTILAASLGTSFAATAADSPPADAIPPTAWELVTIFRGKTWAWPTGGGYFARDRGFVAHVEEGGSVTTAKGRWLVTDDGHMCLKAVWGAEDAGVTTTCFEHVSDDGTIYQRNTAKGDWYIFKHATPTPDDEYQKLSAGNKLPGTPQ